MTYVLRFIKNNKPNKAIGILTAEELHQSLIVLVKQSQRDSFPTGLHSLSTKKSLNSKSHILHASIS